jgi:hypothetical protein
MGQPEAFRSLAALPSRLSQSRTSPEASSTRTIAISVEDATLTGKSKTNRTTYSAPPELEDSQEDLAKRLIEFAPSDLIREDSIWSQQRSVRGLRLYGTASLLL